MVLGTVLGQRTTTVLEKEMGRGVMDLRGVALRYITPVLGKEARCHKAVELALATVAFQRSITALEKEMQHTLELPKVLSATVFISVSIQQWLSAMAQAK